MITKLNLKNWRSHLNTDMEFSDGTNCFIGSMGAGKTSIMDAICFALFGTFPTLQAKKIKLEDIIMKKPKLMEEAEVNLTFLAGNDEWSIKRTIKKGKTSAELYRGKQLIEGPQPQKVNSEIERLLKVNYDLFTRAIYSEQNQLDMFLTIPKGQRMKKIDELLSIDKFENARATVKAVTNKCKFTIDERNALLNNLKSDETLMNIEEIKKELSLLKQEKKETEIKYLEIKNRRGRTGNDMLIMKKQEKDLRDIDTEIEKSKDLMTEIDKDIERLKDELIGISEVTTEQLKNDYTNINNELTEVTANQKIEKENLEKLERFLMQKKLKIDSIEKEKIPEYENKKEQRKEIEKKIKLMKATSLKKDIEEFKDKLEKCQNSIQKSYAIIEQTKESLAELEKTGDQCPICDNPLGERKKKSIIESKQENIERQETNIKKNNTQTDNIKKEISEMEDRLVEATVLNEKLKDMENIEKEIKFLKDAAKQLDLEIDAHEKEKKMLQKVIEIADEKLIIIRDRHERIRQMLSKKQELTYKIDRIKTLELRIYDLRRDRLKYDTFSQSALQNLETEFQNLIGLENKLQAKSESMQTLLEEKEKRFESVEQKIIMIDNYEKEINKISGIEDQLKILEKALLSTQGQLRKNFIIAVNQAMESIWPELYPYDDMTNVRLDIDSGDYVLQLEDSTGWIAADGIASGGERSTACLALRIAFALVLAPQLRWLVLDEPTHNLDSRAVEDLANVLREKVSTIVDQIFLITHDSNLETAVSGYLYRLERDKGRDEATKVTKVSGPNN